MSKKIVLRNVRLSYEHIFNATTFEDGGDAKFSADFIIPKDHPNLPAVKKAMFEAGQEEFPSAFAKAGKWPKGYTCSLKDADVETDANGELLAEKNPACAGCYVLSANSSKRPVVVNRDKSAITEQDGIVYSGCYVNASLNASGYTFGKVKKGVKCYLNGVQFVVDGERFGMDAADDFDVIDDDETDFM